MKHTCYTINNCTLPTVNLGFFPTPLHELKTLSKKLGGPRIFIKRDDLTGLALGGNKIRKLAFILGDALQQGADTIITAGASQSNHCRQTAAAAAHLQLGCHLLLGGDAPSQYQGNLLLDKLFGCHIHWSGAHRKGEDIPQLVATLKAQNKHPYCVPYGGSNKLGAMGFVQASDELAQQTQASGIKFSHLIFASSSGGTHAGLMLGKRLFAASYQVIGINIDKEESGEQSFTDAIITLANQTATFINLQERFSPDDLNLNHNYTGNGYGVIGEREKQAIALLAQTEGILLDPVYTGRAMGGLIDMIQRGELTRNDTVLFWHTGGAPALFAYAEFLQDDTLINSK